MLKFNRVLSVLALCAVVGVAWGAINKISAFVVEDTASSCSGVCSDTGGPCTGDSPCADGATCLGIGDQFPIGLDPAADGMAILNYAQGGDKTIVQVILSDFSGAPLPRFIVRLVSNAGSVELGTILVDSQGNGNFHGEVAGDHSGSNVELYQQIQAPSASCPAVLIATGQ